MRSTLLTSSLLLLLVAACIGIAAAEEKYGVAVYTGATYEAETSQWVAQQMKVEASCYRTNATVAQVNEFYKKQPGVTVARAASDGGMFTKGTIHVTVQSPWIDIKNQRESKDTLISIVKTK